MRYKSAAAVAAAGASDNDSAEASMARYAPISANLSVGPQPALADFAALAEAGFKTVVTNRPDGEAAEQPDHGEAEEAADAAGLTYHYLPVTADSIGEEDIAAFHRLLAESPTPVFAHCASGTRSALLWALGASDLSAREAIDRAAEAGIDLSGHAARLATRRGGAEA